MLQRQLIRVLQPLSVRCSSTDFVGPNDDISPTLNNRNPRNLEKMRIALKPNGYALDKPGKKFWHKLEIVQSNRYITANITHYLNGPVIRASTSEWAIKKQLYKQTDTSAYINLAKILARRCLQSGIMEVRWDIQPPQGGKVEKFLQNFESCGVALREGHVYKKPNPWDRFRPEKPWEVVE